MMQMRKKENILLLLFVFLITIGAKAQFVDVSYEELPVEVQQKMDENKILGLNYFTGIIITLKVELLNIQENEIQMFIDKLAEDERVKNIKLSPDAKNLIIKAQGDYTIKDVDNCTYVTQGWVEDYSKTFAIE